MPWKPTILQNHASVIDPTTKHRTHGTGYLARATTAGPGSDVTAVRHSLHHGGVISGVAPRSRPAATGTVGLRPCKEDGSWDNNDRYAGGHNAEFGRGLSISVMGRFLRHSIVSLLLLGVLISVTRTDHVWPLLREFAVSACGGETVSLSCPRHTALRVQGATRAARAHAPCPSPPSAAHAAAHGDHSRAHNCTDSALLQRALQQCQDKRRCELRLPGRPLGPHGRPLGPHGCPSSVARHSVSYRCRPISRGPLLPADEYQRKVACEEDWLQLRCKNSRVVAVQAATFGRSKDGGLECPSPQARASDSQCQSPEALAVLVRRCQGLTSCSVETRSGALGNPCPPGVRKYLAVLYTCVPRRVLDDRRPRGVRLSSHSRSLPEPRAAPSLSREAQAAPPGPAGRGHPHGYAVRDAATHYSPPAGLMELQKEPADGPKFSEGEDADVPTRLNATDISPGAAIILNTLATYSYLSKHVERAALVFVSCLCLGLVLTLAALVVRVHCRHDVRSLKGGARARASRSDGASDDSDTDSDSESDSDSDGGGGIGGIGGSTSGSNRFARRFDVTHNVFTSAEEIEMAHRIEERERILNEIWRNGRTNPIATTSLNRYY
ncbi:unnamed protein product [Lampetra fluviatilis]